MKISSGIEPGPHLLSILAARQLCSCGTANDSKVRWCYNTWNLKFPAKRVRSTQKIVGFCYVQHPILTKTIPGADEWIPFNLLFCNFHFWGTQLVEALRYKPEGRGFDSRWCHWIFHWHNPSGRTVALGSTQPLTEMSTRNVSWGKGGRCVGLTALPPSCADCLDLGASTSWKPQGL